MNLTSLWYWKKFYWKVFTTIYTTFIGGMIAGLAVAPSEIIDTILAQKLIFWFALTLPVIKGLDALIDTTLATLSNNSPDNGGSGKSPTQIANAPSPAIQPTTQQTLGK